MAALDSRCAQDFPDDDDDAEGEVFDYGYGDQEQQPEGCWPPAEEDLGYEDVDVCSPSINREDFDTDTSSPGMSTSTRPKRRCSITKFSLESATPLNAASVINDFRNNPVLIATTSTCDKEELPTKVFSSQHRHNTKEFLEESTHTTTCNESSASSSSSSSIVGDAAAAVTEEQLPSSQHSATRNKTSTDRPIIGTATTTKKKFLARFFQRPSRRPQPAA